MDISRDTRVRDKGGGAFSRIQARRERPSRQRWRFWDKGAQLRLIFHQRQVELGPHGSRNFSDIRLAKLGQKDVKPQNYFFIILSYKIPLANASA